MFTNLFPGRLPLGSFNISNATLVTICVSIVMMVLLTLLSTIPKWARHAPFPRTNGAAQLMGINVNNTISFTFAIGSALAAVAAVLYCCSYQQIEPTMGSMLGLKAFVAAVLGGIGSIPGAVLGGLLIGVAESFTKGTSPPPLPTRWCSEF